MNTPADKTIAFLLVSHPLRDLAMRWQARLTFPPGADERTVLTLSVENGDGTPVKKGVLEFAGRSLRIADGKGSLGYADFIRGIHERGVWLHRVGMPPIPGGPTFG